MKRSQRFWGAALSLALAGLLTAGCAPKDEEPVAAPPTKVGPTASTPDSGKTAPAGMQTVTLKVAGMT